MMWFVYIPHKKVLLESLGDGENASHRNKNLVCICRLVGEIYSRNKYSNRELRGNRKQCYNFNFTPNS